MIERIRALLDVLMYYFQYIELFCCQPFGNFKSISVCTEQWTHALTVRTLFGSTHECHQFWFSVAEERVKLRELYLRQFVRSQVWSVIWSIQS